MSMPTLIGTVGRQHDRLIKLARIQLSARRPQMSKRPRTAEGKFAPKSEVWVRESDGQERHLPYFLGGRDE